MTNWKEMPAWQHLQKYRPLLYELVVRDLKVKYRRSFLGYLWSLLNPLLMMAVMSFVFSYIFRYDIENYPLYLICGQTLWGFFNESTNMAMYSVLQNGSLIKKVYIPKFIFPMSRVMSSFTNLLFSMAAIEVVMLVSRVPLHWTLLLFWVPLLLLLLFCIGIGMLLSALATFFQDIVHMYGVFTLALTYLTPIFYPVDADFLPQYAMNIIRCNPLYYYITFFRDVTMYGRLPAAYVLVGSVLFSAAALAVGFGVFRKLQKNFVLYV